MKNLKIKKYLLATIFYIVLLTITIYLPSNITYFLDQKYLGRVNFLERTPIEITYNSNITQKLQTMIQAEANQLSAIRLFSTSHKNFLIDIQLISKIQEELNQLFALEGLENIAKYNLEDYFLGATYYSIQSSFEETSENNNVLVWKISFSDFESFAFSFLLDAQSYKIYGAKIFCKEVSSYINQLFSSQAQVDQLNEVFRKSCQTYYEADISNLYTISQPNVILELTYGDLTVFPRRNILMETSFGSGVEIGFIDLWNALIY